MSIGKKEIKLLVVLGVLLYAFLFYMVFVNNYIPEINDVNSKLSEAKAKESALEKDLENIEQKKSELKSKKVVSERIGNYVPEVSGVFDCISYMIKLQKLMGNKLEEVKINQPEAVNVTVSSNNSSTSNVEQVKTEISDTGLGDGSAVPADTQAQTGKQYYSVAINFKANLAYNEIWELLSYIEGGSRRIKVSEFSIEQPKSDANATNTAKPTQKPTNSVNQTGGITPIGQLYNVTAAIKIYAQDIEEANKIFSSSKNRFNKYDESSGLVFTVSSNTGTNNSTAVRNNSSTSSQNNTAKNQITEPDFILEETGYFTAGENFLVRGVDKYNDFFRYKTSGRTDVQLTINENRYTMNITYAVGKTKTISGSVPSRDLNADLKVDVGEIKENEKIKVNYKVVNNSSHKLHLNVFDPGARIKVLDRSGSIIKGNSQKEKVSIN